ncbi:shikimate dehydrogenase [Heliorestis convoluta]|uniref:Shikimate dehydrogenase (NADP(+)) n=1 Tax=Heliorestis convoluta TaxID=356322 RepID=A0A5Q2MW89_9FIRM|nr:shikimate dehydrogenase [Heliorestis convoluta]QGG46598.1 shikimate dehydrogenase [Heliorestis convoluta]
MINGQTNWIALLGDPVAHTFSPAMHNAAFDHLQMNWRYAAHAVKPQNLHEALQGLIALHYRGLNITVPHKEKILPMLDEVDPLAAAIGAVNSITIREGRTKGYNTDAIGFIRGLREDNFDPQGKKALILGAGGAARAVALALIQEGIKTLTIVNRSFQKAEELLKNLETYSATMNNKPALSYRPFEPEVLQKDLNETDLLINGTSLGMVKEGKATAYPFPPRLWLPEKRGLYVADLVYNPIETELLQEAKKRGQKRQNGLPMLLYQGAVAFEQWTDVPAPVTIMAQALEAYRAKMLTPHARPGTTT